MFLICDNDLVVVIETRVGQVRDIFCCYTGYSIPKEPRGLY